MRSATISFVTSKGVQTKETSAIGDDDSGDGEADDEGAVAERAGGKGAGAVRAAGWRGSCDALSRGSTSA